MGIKVIGYNVDILEKREFGISMLLKEYFVLFIYLGKGFLVLFLKVYIFIIVLV